MPISITFSLLGVFGSYLLLPSVSVHSKLLLVDKDTSMLISLVSVPLTTSGLAKTPVTTQEPGGTGEEADSGLGTVVAPAGACPALT